MYLESLLNRFTQFKKVILQIEAKTSDKIYFLKKIFIFTNILSVSLNTKCFNNETATFL